MTSVLVIRNSIGLALPPGILKLDMRLFQAAAWGGPSGEVVKALTQMVEKTGCRLIAAVSTDMLTCGRYCSFAR